jgi:hypothetical protein
MYSELLTRTISITISAAVGMSTLPMKMSLFSSPIRLSLGMYRDNIGPGLEKQMKNMISIVEK